MLKRKVQIEKTQFRRGEITKLPESPGVYIFSDAAHMPIYVGKAKNLKARVRSYLNTTIAGKTAQMISDTKFFSKISVNSELEALLLEAKLVKKYQTKYNSALRDDKHPIYIKITDEKYPRVLTARKQDAHFLGPFPATTNVSSVLKLLRRIFPFSQHKLGKRGCLYSQIGLCNPCPNEIERIKNAKEKYQLLQEYRGNIKYIKAILSGRFSFVRNSLIKLMHEYSQEENFEMAKVVRNQITQLDYITQPVIPVSNYLKNPNLLDDIREGEVAELRQYISKYIRLPKTLRRIECYDVAHLAGYNPTASMVTFIDGEAEKTLYRHFRIHLPAGKAGQKKGKSDTDSMYEVAERRAKYLSNWGAADLIIVDGGKAQVTAFLKVFSEYRIPVIGLAKREEKLVIPIQRNDLSTHRFISKAYKDKVFIERIVPRGPAKNLVVRIRDEAHRFARRYHHKLLQKELIPN